MWRINMPMRQNSRSVMSARRDGGASITARNLIKPHEISETIQERLATDVQKATMERFRDRSLLAAKEKKSSPFRSRVARSRIDDVERGPPPPQPEGPDQTDGPCMWPIIMDGNGRWSAARGLPRAEGHRRRRAERGVRARQDLGILYLTIFFFSIISETGRGRLPKSADTVRLLRRFISKILATLHSDGRPVACYRRNATDWSGICALLNEAAELTQRKYQLHSFVAFSTTDRA